MNKFALAVLIAGFFFPPVVHRVSGEETTAWDQSYDLIREAYRDREAGNEETAREKMAQALAIFRRTAVDRAPRVVRPEVEFLAEESPSGINLIENRTLFKIEFRSNPPPPLAEPPDQEPLIRQQQLIIQNLARVIQDNAELKAILTRVDSSTEDSSAVSDMVSEIRDETSDLGELATAISDIKDRTDDMSDNVERLSDDSDTLRAVEDLAGEISDLRDALDLLRDILDIVQDIKDDTDGIRDLESRIDDVKSAVESNQE